MFGLFKRKENLKPHLSSADKDWVENNFIWFIEVFGLEKLKTQPFIILSTENFPYNNLEDSAQFELLFQQLCRYWDVNRDEIEVKFFDDVRSKQWSNLAPIGSINEPGGTYNQVYTTDQKRFIIRLAKSNLANIQMTISILSHELGHVKLLGSKFIYANDPDLEPLTDLASIFFGFGLFAANTVISGDINWLGRLGYLKNEVISYANALICYCTENDASTYKSLLNNNTRRLFEEDYQFLITTNDTLLSKSQLAKSEAANSIGRQIEKGFDTRDFASVIEANGRILATMPKNTTALANMGYALLLQKKYHEAIEYFTKTVAIDPYNDYAFNNRGYCSLQLGDLENAFTDLLSAFEMNPDNSFSWRNLGAYYLATGDFTKALEYFEQVQKMDPKTALINFYLSRAHLLLGNADLSKTYLVKSKDLDEYNDSVIV